MKERANSNFDHPDSLETELLIYQLTQLKNGVPVEIPVYDFSTHSRRDQAIKVLPRPIILVEGILLLNDPELRKLLDLKVFVDLDSVRRKRRKPYTNYTNEIKFDFFFFF